MAIIRKHFHQLRVVPSNSHQEVVIGKSLDAVKDLEKLVGLDLTSPLPESKL